eukprot:15476891-Alexandrium_andersonii.AAC.1
MYGRGPRNLPKEQWGEYYLPNNARAPAPPEPPATVARDEGGGADVEMGDEKKTLTRAAHVPWLEIGSKGVKSMIPGMDGPSGGSAPPTQRDDEREDDAMIDEDAHQVDRDACEGPYLLRGMWPLRQKPETCRWPRKPRTRSLSGVNA